MFSSANCIPSPSPRKRDKKPDCIQVLRVIWVCREDKEKEQRRRRGLPSESEEEDDVDLKNGDPFKTYSKSELEKKVLSHAVCM